MKHLSNSSLLWAKPQQASREPLGNAGRVAGAGSNAEHSEPDLGGPDGPICCWNICSALGPGKQPRARK